MALQTWVLLYCIALLLLCKLRDLTGTFSFSHVRVPFAQLVHIPHFSISTFLSQTCHPSQVSFTGGKEKFMERNNKILQF